MRGRSSARYDTSRTKGGGFNEGCCSRMGEITERSLGCRNMENVRNFVDVLDPFSWVSSHCPSNSFDQILSCQFLQLRIVSTHLITR